MGKRFDVLVAGLQCLDMGVIPVDRGILDRQITRVEQIQMSPGGDAVNQAATLSLLGAKTCLMGAVGTDPLSDTLLGALRRYPMTVLDRRIDAAAAASVVLTDSDGERHFLFQPGANERLAYEDLEESALRDASVVSVAGAMALPGLDGAGMLRLLETAKRAGAETAMDFRMLRRQFDKDALHEAIRLTDYLLPSEEEASWLTGEKEDPAKMAQGLRSLGAKNCVVKLGGRGCYVSCGGTEGYYGPYPCRCVDTTGAGDTFVGAFLYGLTRGWGAGECARFANAAGSLAVEQTGANGAVRSEAQVFDRMKENS